MLTSTTGRTNWVPTSLAAHGGCPWSTAPCCNPVRGLLAAERSPDRDQHGGVHLEARRSADTLLPKSCKPAVMSLALTAVAPQHPDGLNDFQHFLRRVCLDADEAS